ncbi:MAG: exodeoxyribonuclease III [Thermoplasmata archaeon]
MNLKLVSWNLNGLRAAIKNGLFEFIKNINADIISFQEIKVDIADLPLEIYNLGYNVYLNSAVKKGYSGTLVLSRIKPLAIKNGIGNEKFDCEGRVQTLEFDYFYYINSYFPNSQPDLKRLEYKLEFNKIFLGYTENLRKNKPLVIAGDFNVAHTELDIARPKENEHNAGFTKEERAWMSEFLDKGYIDTFRIFNKDGGHYSWWSYRFNARAKNIGWRIDYMIITIELLKHVKNSSILEGVKGSDHAPILLELIWDS